MSNGNSPTVISLLDFLSGTRNDSLKALKATASNVYCVQPHVFVNPHSPVGTSAI
ncbi:hypothetical protein CC2G_013955 [Coprinopsis cinerea AmutBmut pab1-1]|nr:hypothetical protein CC2G_013955 [Coprinopsis cinerea AmutBmut pab1-1]